jgi:hypothetical protein
MKKLISFSLWGNNPLYLNGALWNAENSKIYYPDWVCRFYIDNSIKKEFVNKLISFGSEIREMNETADGLGMFWRFHPMFDDNQIERFIVRDCDSKFSHREKRMVDEWIKSEKPFHIIRDCASHGTAILGGTWGAIPNCIPKFEERMSIWFSQIQPDIRNPRGFFHGNDQMFLHKYVWPIIKNNHLAHIRVNCPGLRYSGNEIEVDDPVDGHYVGMVV